MVAPIFCNAQDTLELPLQPNLDSAESGPPNGWNKADSRTIFSNLHEGITRRLCSLKSTLFTSFHIFKFIGRVVDCSSIIIIIPLCENRSIYYIIQHEKLKGNSTIQDNSTEIQNHFQPRMTAQCEGERERVTLEATHKKSDPSSEGGRGKSKAGSRASNLPATRCQVTS